MKLTDTQSRHIQILRGISILAVVLIHNTPAGMSQVFVRPFLNFCVGTFLFLSGFLSSTESWNPKKRIIKVFVPYVIWSLVYVCANNLDAPSGIPVEYVKALILGNASAIMYYIFVYAEFTLLIPVIHKLANSKYKYIGFVIAPVEIIFMRTLPMLGCYEPNFYLQRIIDLSCLGWFTYFYLGYLIANRKLTVKIPTVGLLGLLSVTLLLQMAEGYLYYALGQENCGTQVKLTNLLSTTFFVLLAYKFILSKKPRSGKLLYVLGNYSFGIYFSHLAVMFVFRQIPYYAEYVIYPINAVLVTAVSLALCCLGKKILGRYSWLMALC